MNISGKTCKLIFFLLLLHCSNTVKANTEEKSRCTYMFNDTTRHWHLDPSKYEFSMTIIGMISNGEQNGTEMDHELGAFHNGELRGSARACYISNNNSYVFFLTIFGNNLGDSIQFNLYNHSSGEIVRVEGVMDFRPDTHSGEILSPVPFSLTTTSTTEILKHLIFKVFPNPTSNYLQIESIDKIDHVMIFNLEGRVCKTISSPSTTDGRLILNVSSLLHGYYIVQVKGGDYLYRKRFLKN